MTAMHEALAAGGTLDPVAWDTPERAALRRLAADFTRREIVPHLAGWEDAGELPRSLHQAAAGLGLLGAGFPESLGGIEDPLASMHLTEAMIGAGASTGLIASLFTHGIALPSIVRYGTADQQRRFVVPTLRGELIGALGVTEPDTGSDVAGLATRAVRDGDHYVVNGAKTYITSGVRADFVSTAVRTGGDGYGGISLLVVEKGTPGFTVSRRLDKMGWRCSDTAELTFQSARVPSSNLVGEENLGVALIGGGFLSERIAMAAQAYSQGQRRLDLAAQWCRDRTTFGAPLICRPSVQDTPTEMARRVDVARTYTRSVADRSLEADLVAEVCFAKNTATETGQWVAHQAVRLFGGMGYKAESNVEQQYRDMRIMGIGGGAVETLRQLAARSLGLTS